MKVRHQISRDYISTSHAIAERAVRSMLEGTRANLLQAGHITVTDGYWPYAARHWCIMHDAARDGTGKVRTHPGNSVLDLISQDL